MCVLEIRPGRGGDDARDFAETLADAIIASCSRPGRPRTAARGTTATRGITVTIPGQDPDPLLWLAGLHRRMSVPRAQVGRRGSKGSRGEVRQTSYATVVILPDSPATDLVALGPGGGKDVRVDVFRSSGPGGQGVNTTDSAVRVTHLPTGVSATCQDGRSQTQNRAAALAQLARRLSEQSRAAAAGQANAARQEQAAGPVVFTHTTWLDRVRHEPTGASWSLRAWAQGKAADPSPARLSRPA